MSTIAQALHWGIEALQSHDNPRLEASILLAHALQRDRTWLVTWPEHVVSTEQMTHYQQLITRRQQQEPLAYIIGTQAFWDHEFTVTPHTLIPRPDTETLIHTILETLPETPLTLLDAGTGSGIIACTLALARPQWNLYATDVSWEALQVARKNAEAIGASVQWVCADWLACFANNSIDAIVSNPPYIAADDLHLLKDGLPFEPQNALIAGKTGFECYEKIVAQARRVLKNGGVIVLEHGFEQQERLMEMLIEIGFVGVRGMRDAGGQARVVVGRM